MSPHGRPRCGEESQGNCQRDYFNLSTRFLGCFSLWDFLRVKGEGGRGAGDEPAVPRVCSGPLEKPACDGCVLSPPEKPSSLCHQGLLVYFSEKKAIFAVKNGVRERGNLTSSPDPPAMLDQGLLCPQHPPALCLLLTCLSRGKICPNSQNRLCLRRGRHRGAEIKGK